MDSQLPNPMDNPPPNGPEMAQYMEAQKRTALQARIRAGLSWFYWIAGLSLVNSVARMMGASINFVIGLGASQVIDEFAQGVAQEIEHYDSLTGPFIALGMGFVLNIALAALFASLGFLGIKQKRWSAIVGIVLYGLDSLILLFASSWLGLAFHAFALWGIWNGIKALNLLKDLEKPSVLTSPPVVIEAYRPPLSKSRIMEIALSVAVMPLSCLFLATVIFYLYVRFSP